ncbi:BTAD domain-containing putative transcriptional regulator [Saccharothrix sp.]|uniref:AfsR/SARP family transcriptional regulator n=1 Tax=Saccharothrix sp. TaxID=1873460 RepID=UPI0028126FB4|nr:BTAD domain-containing putative transcriptional regulator [Saccharothrix sp.]
MRFGVLGPVAAWRGDAAVRIGGPREKKLLAVLLLAHGRAVGLDRLITVMWDDEPPGTSRAQVHNCAAALRRNLGVPITWASAGLVLDADDVDAHRFQALVREADDLVAARRLTGAADRLRAALALWRGPALAGLGGRVLAAEADRLEAQRLACLERRLDVDLELGRHRDLVGELTTLVAEHPLRESWHAKLMLALYRSGRRADALDAYQRAREVLADELGLAPGPALAELEVMVLRDDAALRHDPGPRHDLPWEETAPGGDAAPRPRPPTPRQLPADIGGFTGRRAELAALDAVVDRPLVLITGPAGIGKTSLAVHWARRVADRFADGQLHVDLRGHSWSPEVEPAEALGRLLRALGVPPEDVPADVDEAAAAYRTALAGRRVVVVLDNARSVAQVRPLLPGEPGCLVLVTSRHRLPGLVAREGGHRVEPAALPVPDALELLRRHVGADRVASEPAEAAELVRLCGGLPLALRIAAAAVADQPLAEYVRRLHDERLGGLSLGDDDQADVRRAFDLSYERLSPAARRLFGLLGVVPGDDFAVAAAQALSGGPDVRPVLDELTATHLLERRASGRFGFHDLLGLYAARLAPADEARRASARLLEHYLSRVEDAARALYPDKPRLPVPTSGAGFPDETAASAWLDAERVNLVAAVRAAPGREAVALADGLRGYFELRGLHADWRVAADAALRAAEEPRDRAAATLNSAAARFGGADYDLAEHEYGLALDLARAADWPAGEAEAHSRMGIVLWETERLHPAVDHLRAALRVAERADDPAGQAAAWHNLGVLLWHLGELEGAAAHFERGAVLFAAAGSVSGTSKSRTCLGGVLSHLGKYAEAHDLLEQAVAVHARLGNRSFEALGTALIAVLHRDSGDLGTAVTRGRSAVRLAEDQGFTRNRVDVLNMVGAVLVTASPEESRRHLVTARALSQVGRPYLAGVVQACRSLAELSLTTGQVSGARALGERALVPARRAGYRMEEGTALTTLALGALTEHDLMEARTLAVQAESVLEPTGYRYGTDRAAAVLARCTAG